MTPATATTVAALATQTTSGTGAVVDLGAGIDTLRLTLDVTAVSGATPSLVVAIETSADGLAAWRAAKTSASVAAVGQTRLACVVDRFVRAKWTLTGTTPSFTFSLAGEKLKPYANLTYFRRLHAGGLFAKASDEDLEAYLASAGVKAAGYLSTRYKLPLTAWDDDVRKAVSSLAAWSYVSERLGFNPEAPGDAAFRTNHDDAMAWLRGVARYDVSPPGIVDSTPEEVEEYAVVYTDESRRW